MNNLMPGEVFRHVSEKIHRIPLSAVLMQFIVVSVCYESNARPSPSTD